MTTVQISFPCRVLTSSEEFDNVMNVGPLDEIMVVSRELDPNTFQPTVTFMVGKAGTRLRERMFFQIEIRLIYDSKSAEKYRELTDEARSDKLESYRKAFEEKETVSLMANFISYQKKALDEKNAKYGTNETLETPIERSKLFVGTIERAKLREVAAEWDPQDSTSFS